MGFTREQLDSYRDLPVPDLIAPGVALVFVGINPGLWTAATQTHFCHPSNRFWPAMRHAGLVDWTVDPDTGMTDEQRRDLLSKGIGITNLVNRATARAAELSREELRKGGVRLRRLVEELSPQVVAVAGVTAYRDAFGLPSASLGPQPSDLGPARVWVVPNPSGLNAHHTIATLADWYRGVAEAAGIA